LVVSLGAARECFIALGEMRLFAGSTVVELGHHIDIVIALNGGVVSELFLFNLHESSARSLR